MEVTFNGRNKEMWIKIENNKMEKSCGKRFLKSMIYRMGSIGTCSKVGSKFAIIADLNAAFKPFAD